MVALKLQCIRVLLICVNCPHLQTSFACKTANFRSVGYVLLFLLLGTILVGTKSCKVLATQWHPKVIGLGVFDLLTQLRGSGSL